MRWPREVVPARLLLGCVRLCCWYRDITAFIRPWCTSHTLASGLLDQSISCSHIRCKISRYAFSSSWSFLKTTGSFLFFVSIFQFHFHSQFVDSSSFHSFILSFFRPVDDDLCVLVSPMYTKTIDFTWSFVFLLNLVSLPFVGQLRHG
jgi:hypothetical protein